MFTFSFFVSDLDYALSAKILGRMILADPSLRCYSDVGRKAFGPWSTPMISLMFCLELFAVGLVIRLCIYLLFLIPNSRNRSACC